MMECIEVGLSAPTLGWQLVAFHRSLGGSAIGARNKLWAPSAHEVLFNSERAYRLGTCATRLSVTDAWPQMVGLTPEERARNTHITPILPIEEAKLAGVIPPFELGKEYKAIHIQCVQPTALMNDLEGTDPYTNVDVARQHLAQLNELYGSF